MAWLNPNDPNSGAALLTQEQIENQRKVAAAMAARATKARPMTHWAQAVAQGMDGMWAGLAAADVGRASERARAHDATLLSGDLSVPGSVTGSVTPSVDTGPGGTAAIAGGGTLNVAPEIKDGIAQTASALGISPVDLATAISYETGGTFDPTKAGPTTKWGRHRGLIQFGEPQAREHGVDWSNPVGSQLGPNGAVASYLRKAGVQPGMGLLDIYSAINAGAPGLYNRSDAAAGGAPGTVRDKVERQMQGHRAKAQALFAAAADMPAPGASPVAMETGADGFVVPGVQRGDTIVSDPLQNPIDTGTSLPPQEALQNAVQPAAAPAPVAAPAPMDARTFNAVQAGGLEPVFQSEGVSQPWMNTAIAPAPSPAARVAQAMQGAPTPPPRPTSLPTPQADLPAPGAVPAIGQMPPAAMPDLSNTNDAGARAFAVAEGERRMGQTPAPMAGPTAAMPVAQASLPAAATPAAASPAQRVAQAVAASQGSAPSSTQPASPAQQGVAAALGGVNPRVLAAATSPYASAQTKAVAQIILKQQLEQAQYTRPEAVEARKLELDLKRKQLAGDPDAAEGRRLENELKRKQLEKPADAPTVRTIKQPDGSEVAVQFDPKTQAWIPLVAPQGGNAVRPPLKLTEAQSKDLVYFNRGVQALEEFEKNSGAYASGLERAATQIPGGNYLNSEEFQKAQQSGRNFLASILRKDTGAAITAAEEKQYGEIFLPQPGDKPGALALKSEARRQAIKAIKGGLGTAEALALGSQILSRKDAPATGSPTVGEIRKGYRFKGGDPSQQSSWEKAQ